MTARPDADPAPATEVAGAGSRRPGVVPLLVVAVVLTAVVQGVLLQSYFVPTSALAPDLEAGDRVLVWKAPPAAAAGDVVVVDTTGSAGVDRATPVDDGPVGRMLSALGDLLGVEPGRRDALAVVASATGEDVTLASPVPGTVRRDDVVGTVVMRVWPLGRLGRVGRETP